MSGGRIVSHHLLQALATGYISVTIYPYQQLPNKLRETLTWWPAYNRTLTSKQSSLLTTARYPKNPLANSSSTTHLLCCLRHPFIFRYPQGSSRVLLGERTQDSVILEYYNLLPTALPSSACNVSFFGFATLLPQLTQQSSPSSECCTSNFLSSGLPCAQWTV